MNVSNGLDAAILAVSRTAADYADDVDRVSRIPEEAVHALQTEAMMGLLVPPALGGPGRSMSQVASVCHALAQSCGSSAMIYAMHQIQVACVVAHGAASDWHRALLQRVCAEQLLLGSVTSEVGTGGNIHASVCAVEAAEGRARLKKKATTISYGARADGLLITARRNATAAANDQVMVVALRGDYELDKTSDWDALGMRGTCSEGFRLSFCGDEHQVLPVPFSEIAGQTMLPVSHLLWTSVWLGIATGAVNRARTYLRQQVRERGNVSMLSHRLARAVGLLQLMQARLSQSLRDYDEVFAAGARPLPLGFTADMNNLKTTVSELSLEAVQHAFMVCGINAYKNGSEFSLGRHVRDLMSAPVMINNDRMLESTGNLLLMQRPALGVL
ncbi:MAG TPA: acyl-CoA dehydrogenase family protein [Acetobacteraceae bacterium]|jgi:acyl-CoA dehydrogenase|nr:acyl-CoA dehydrogenase family protein [Acetobacteraceae bacterium]